MTSAIFALSLVFSLVFSGSTGEEEDEVYAIESDGGNAGAFSFRTGEEELSANWRGAFWLSDDGNDIEGTKDSIEIIRMRGDFEERLVIDRQGRKTERRYLVDDETSDDAEASKALARDFLRASAAAADERVVRLLSAKGKTGLIEEIGALSTDHARIRYMRLLADKKKLTRDDIAALEPAIRALKKDHGAALALYAIIENAPDGETVSRLAEIARALESDYEKRRLAAAFAEAPYSGQAHEALIALVASIGNDHDMSFAARALMTEARLDAPAQRALLETAAAEIDDAHDLADFLAAALGSVDEKSETFDAWLAVAAGLESGPDRDRVARLARKTHSDKTTRAKIDDAFGN